MARWLRPIPYIPFVIALVGVLAYLNTFGNPFIFDDTAAITGNRNVETLFPVVFTSRWVVDLSFRLNHAVSEFNVADFHAVNLAVHLCAALLLFGIVRRTLTLPRLRERFAAAAPWLAGISALLFVAHPLQTASVTYLCQRYESMMGAFLLGTLYTFIRAVTSATARGRFTWGITAIGVCLIGMGTKEVMLTAPLVVLLYDWIFVGNSVPGTRRLRVGLIIGLFLTLGALVVFEMRMMQAMSAAGHSLTSSASPWIYLATQPEVILHYLRLSVFPTGQCLDYAWPLATGWSAVWPAALMIVATGLLTLWGTCKRSSWAFLGAFFFLVLGPSSSLLPAPDVAFEHRMYLPLAAVLVGIVTGTYLLMRPLLVRYRWLTVALVVMGICATSVLAVATHHRNRTYASSETMWRDVMAKQPGNYRQRLALFYALLKRDASREAETVIRNLITDTQDGFNRGESSMVSARDPFWHHAVARGQLGRLLLHRGDAAGAVVQIAPAIKALPGNAVLHHNMALALVALERHEEALRAGRESVRLDATYINGHWTLAFLLAHHGDYQAAAEHYRLAIRLSPPPHHAISLELAWFLATAPDASVRDGIEAELLARTVCDATGARSVRALDVLAAALAEQERFDEAITTVQQAISLARANLVVDDHASGLPPASVRDWGPATGPDRLRERLASYTSHSPYRDHGLGEERP